MVRAHVRKWGNSLAVRIPSSFAEEIGLQEDGQIEMSVSDGKVLIEPATSPTYSLDQLLDRVTDDNLHPEVDWGEPVGNEVW